jgi:purine nucleoside phosphorylase
VAVGIITGSGTYALPGTEQEEPVTVETPYGGTFDTPVARGVDE